MTASRLTYTSEGIVLHTLKFRDYDQILTIFTCEEGIIKLLRHGAYRPKHKVWVEPTLRAEFIYEKGRSEIFRCREVSLLQQYLPLRNSLEQLNVTHALLKVIMVTQHPLAAAPALYQLLCAYLDKLCEADCIPLSLLCSFYLKLLHHEGHLPKVFHCSTCQMPLNSCYLQQGECFCAHHAPPLAIPLSHEELQMVAILLQSRSFAAIMSISLPVVLARKIATLLQSTLHLSNWNGLENIL
jgi:DNA repair protein RecO (recombination protein O)